MQIMKWKYNKYKNGYVYYFIISKIGFMYKCIVKFVSVIVMPPYHYYSNGKMFF